MALPAELREDLRGLARKYGRPALIAACADLVKSMALRGVQADAAARAAEAGSAEACPRCRQRDALFAEMKEVLNRCAHEVPHGKVDQPGKAED